MRAATRSPVSWAGASTVAPVRVETACRMSESVELVATMDSRPSRYVTCGGAGGICSGVSGTGGGNGCVWGAGAAGGLDVACLRGFAVATWLAGVPGFGAAIVCAAEHAGKNSSEVAITAALLQKRVIPATPLETRSVP